MTKVAALETDGSALVTPATTSPKRNWFVRSRAWMSIVLLIPFGVVALFSRPRFGSDSFIGVGFDVAAWLVFFVGAVFRWWSTFYIGSRKYWDLVTEGPYSLCRNPLYFGTFLIALSIALFVHSLTFAAGVVLVAMYYLMLTVSWEEVCLEDRFGTRFVQYCREVPRFWPRWSHFRSPETIEVHLQGLRAEAMRMMRWMWVPVLALLIAHLRDLPSWPNHFHLP